MSAAQPISFPSGTPSASAILRSEPNDSPYTPCYYRNLSRDDLAAALTPAAWRDVEIEHDRALGDLRAVAFRR